MKLKMAETESFQRNAPRLTGGTPATRRRKVGGRSGSPHRGRRARRGVSGAPNRRAVRPARGRPAVSAQTVTVFGICMLEAEFRRQDGCIHCSDRRWEGFVAHIALGRDLFPHCKDRYRCVTRRQLSRCAMSWWQQVPRPIQCRSCTGSVPLRGVLRPSRLPERNRHAGDLWRPQACLMTVWGQGEPDSSRKRPAKGALAIVLARDRSLGAIECERACTTSRATTGAQLGSG
jgi:hypothetical protein